MSLSLSVHPNSILFDSVLIHGQTNVTAVASDISRIVILVFQTVHDDHNMIFHIYTVRQFMTNRFSFVILYRMYFFTSQHVVLSVDAL